MPRILPPEGTRPVLAFSITVDRDSLPNPEAFAAVHEAFCERYQGRLKWFANGDRNKLVPFRVQQAKWPRTRLAKPARDDALWITHDGDDLRGFGTALLKAWACIRDRDAHFLFCSVPPTVEDRAWLWAQAFALADEVPIFQGAMGLSLPMSARTDLDEIAQQTQQVLRFPGIETAKQALSTENLRTVNWITFVSDGLLARVGDLAALQRQLAPPIQWHRVRDGWAIQAGPDPLPGDVNRGDNLPLYRKVARVLRPVRATLYPSVSRDDLESAAWYARFDGADDDLAPPEPP